MSKQKSDDATKMEIYWYLRKAEVLPDETGNYKEVFNKQKFWNLLTFTFVCFLLVDLFNLAQ